MEEAKKTLTVTPEVALNLLNSVAEKYQGTRTDHKALEVGLAVLANVVKEWTEMKKLEQSKKPEEPRANGSKGKGAHN